MTTPSTLIPDPNVKPYLTKDEAAELLDGITTRTVTNMVKDGRLKAVRLGRADRILTVSVLRLLGLSTAA